MTSNGSSWNAIMQYSFLHVFANDGLIDRDELQMLERLALQDGTVDDKEKDVLTRCPDTVFQYFFPHLLNGFFSFHHRTTVDINDIIHSLGQITVGRYFDGLANRIAGWRAQPGCK